MIRVRVADGSLAYRNDPYVLDLLPGNKIFDKVQPSIVFFHRKPNSEQQASAGSNSPNSSFSQKNNSSSASPKKGGGQGCSSSYYKNFPMSSTKIPVHPVKPPHMHHNVTTLTHNQQQQAQQLSPVMVLSPSSSAEQQHLSPKQQLHYATVNVKFGSVTLIAPFRISHGDSVVFEADAGGEHIGVVESVDNDRAAAEDFQHNKLKIIRRARPADLKACSECFHSEPATKQICQQILNDAGIFSVNIPDVEWQLDRRALTCFLSTSPSEAPKLQEDIDRLLDEVYSHLQSHFECKIWLLTSAMNPATLCNNNTGELTSTVGTTSSSLTGSLSEDSVY